MAMTLDEAIQHAQERTCEDACGQEHAQLAAWLCEYKELLKADGLVSDLQQANDHLAKALDEAICMLTTILTARGFPDEVKESEIGDLRDIHSKYARKDTPKEKASDLESDWRAGDDTYALPSTDH